MNKAIDEFIVALEWRLPEELLLVAQIAYMGILALLCDYFANLDSTDTTPLDLDLQRNLKRTMRLLKQGSGGPVKDADAPGLDP